ITAYFFFQAEDGIRDRNVTGVQTCALPISEIVYDLYQEILITHQPHGGTDSMNVTAFDFSAKQNRPGKIVALHLNYPSRIEQRGSNQKFPGNFLKATSSI